MNSVQMLYLLGSAAIGIVLAGLTARGGTSDSHPRDRVTMAMLAGLMLSLLAVGVVSGTLLRHVIQIAPLAAAVVLVASGSRLGAAAATPLFTFWLGIMVNIWLFLLGVARIFSGRFTPTEIALTIAMAVLCVVGLVACVRRPSSLARGASVATAGVSALMQVAALMASL